MCSLCRMIQYESMQSMCSPSFLILISCPCHGGCWILKMWSQHKTATYNTHYEQSSSKLNHNIAMYNNSWKTGIRYSYMAEAITTPAHMTQGIIVQWFLSLPLLARLPMWRYVRLHITSMATLMMMRMLHLEHVLRSIPLNFISWGRKQPHTTITYTE